MKKQKLFLSMLLLSIAMGVVDAGDKPPVVPPAPPSSAGVPTPPGSKVIQQPNKGNQNKPGQKKSAVSNAQPPKALESKRKQFCARTGIYKDQNKYKAFQDAFCGRTSAGGKAGRFDDHAVQGAIDAGGLNVGGTKTPVPTLVRALIFEKKPKQGGGQHHDQGKGDHNQHPGNQHQNQTHHPASHHDQGQGAQSHKGALTISNTGVHDDVQKKLNIEMGFKVLENGVLKMIHPVHQFSIPAKGHQRHENYIPQNVLAELNKNKNNKLIISASTMVNAKCVEAQNLQIHPDDQVEFAVHGGKTVDDPIALVFSVTACGSCDSVTPPASLVPGHHEEKKKP